MIQEFISELNDEIGKGIESGSLKEEYFTTTNHNKNNEVHQRIIPIIVCACKKLGYEVELERGYSYCCDKSGRKVDFIPDISIYKNNKLTGIIEYESTNSSDARFYDPNRKSDLRNLKEYVSDQDNDIPEFWIIISTLPKRSVKYEDWKTRDRKISRRSDEFQDIIKSPFKYYYPKYIEETKKVLDDIVKVAPDMFLLNIDKKKVELEYQQTH